METLFQVFATKKNLDVGALHFTLRGETIDPIATAASLDLVDMIEIEAAWRLIIMISLSERPI